MSSDMQFSLVIKIGDKAYGTLKAGGYNLCLSRMVNETYNTVLFGSSEFHQSNQFQWSDSYTVFGSIKSGTQPLIANVITNPQEIRFNQTCLFDEGAKMNPAEGPIDPSIKHFKVDVDYSGHNVHIGVGQSFCASAEGSDAVISPIHLSGNVVPSTVELTPQNTLIIFFDTGLKTGMNFDRKIRHCLEINYLPGTTSLTYLYGDNLKWELQEGDSPPEDE